jgi:hypothetical protein
MGIGQGEKMQVIILGPNLSNKMQKKGAFHAHATGCGDIKRNYTAHDDLLMQEFESVQDIVEYIFSDFIGDPYGELGYSPQWEDYMSNGEMYVAPCVKIPMSKLVDKS